MVALKPRATDPLLRGLKVGEVGSTLRRREAEPDLHVPITPEELKTEVDWVRVWQRWPS
jgi:hypothetical protein